MSELQTVQDVVDALKLGALKLNASQRQQLYSALAPLTKTGVPDTTNVVTLEKVRRKQHGLPPKPPRSAA